MMAAGQASWASMEVDRETDTGFERTKMYGKYKAMEQYDNQGKSGSVQVMVAGRFFVTVSGTDVGFDVIKGGFFLFHVLNFFESRTVCTQFL
jgi:hypothetical protein